MDTRRITSSDQDLSIALPDCIEPNNGRMLWVAQVYHQGQDITGALFPSNDHYFNFELDHWSLNDTQNRCYYLPSEGSALLIFKEGFRIIRLPYQPLSTLHFWGNLFTAAHLIEIFTHQLRITHLAGLHTTTRPVSLQGLLTAATLSPNSDSLRLHWQPPHSSQTIIQVVGLSAIA